MTRIHALRYVSTAVHHAEALAGEADDLGAAQLAQRLRATARDVTGDLEAAVAAIDEVLPAADVRKRAHEMLTAVYAEVTMRLEERFHPEEASRLSPGGHLDVAERARYRLRHLPESGDGVTDTVRDCRALLTKALFTYESAVDTYLNTCALAQSRKDRALVKSQALRIELERAKHGLLVQAPMGSDIYKRLKKRTVRTKRARWIDDAKAQRLLDRAFV